MSDMIDARAVAAWMRAFAAAVAEHRDELTALDAAIGDADHGINMDRGMQAVAARLDALAAAAESDAAGATAGPDAAGAAATPSGAAAGAGGPAVATVGALLKTVGMTLVSTVGGAAGPLYGTLFLRMATAAGAAEELDVAGLATALAAGVAGVRERGKAEPGDKTMVDALLPAVEALRRAAADGVPGRVALRAAADGAERGMLATVPLVARKGRASYLGERSAGTQDPGATSSWLLLRAAAAALPADLP
jgi:dihydroxyacetone kinase-like protein